MRLAAAGDVGDGACRARAPSPASSAARWPTPRMPSVPKSLRAARRRLRGRAGLRRAVVSCAVRSDARRSPSRAAGCGSSSSDGVVFAMVVFGLESSSEIHERELDAEIDPAHERDRLLQVVLVLAGDAHLRVLDRRLHLELASLMPRDDLPRRLGLDALLDLHEDARAALAGLLRVLRRRGTSG